ncbi:hypothetical protein MOQ_004717 [Trypanosoma cruzi marinkellei]|uniref:Kinesin n=1 Tax=Trypanosoma cruzi marinkellei TaxID=85056 RepID=K2N9D1_TRYCR|nr:hypothetical protein MOQ_004717 [Trypanosoma cruzi marinkellei]
MLTALHVTLPHRRDRDSQQHLPNRCLVVNEATCEASLISTEASLKYASGAANESYESKSRFRFGHVAISPHHGNVFVTQVAPLLYDLCRVFLCSSCSNESGMESRPLTPTTKTTTTAGSDSNGPGISQKRWDTMTARTCRRICRKTWSMSRTVIIYGSHSATERRALFLHLAKAISLALIQETSAMGTETPEKNTCEVSFSLVDLYHAWGVGDALDPNAVMHDSIQLQRLKREEPRRSINEPKGMDFVEPTRHTLEDRDSVSTCLLRALQRVDPPRALRTNAEKEDHAVKSTLVLTFIISRDSKCRVGVSRRRNVHSAKNEKINGRQRDGFSKEARFHLILLPDSTAAAHGKQGAQELGALAGALQACTQWQNEMISAEEEEEEEEEEDEARTQCANYVTATDRHMDASFFTTKSTPPQFSWVPLRESPLLLYLFESTIYYSHQLLQSLRNLRLSKERRRLFSERSHSGSSSISTHSQNAARVVSFSANTSMEQSSCWMNTDTNSANVIQCIAAGIGQCLLIVCVNSGWDQYYQARSAFLFAQRATNQFGQPDMSSNSQTADLSCIFSTEHGKDNPHKAATPTLTETQPLQQLRQQQRLHESFLSLEKTGSEVERQLWSSPRRREKTEPRRPQAEDSQVSELPPSEIAVIECEDIASMDDKDVPSHNLSPPTPSQGMEMNPIQQKVKSKTGLVTRITGPALSLPEQNTHAYPVRQLFRCNQDDPKGAINKVLEENDEGNANKSWKQPETVRENRIYPNYSGLCESPSSTKGVNPGSVPEASSTMVDDVLQKQGLLLQENERLRALLVTLSSQQADAGREQRESTRLKDVCDVTLLESRRAARSSDLNELRRALSITTKKARILQKTLSRSMDENRKLRRLIHSQMKKCCVEFSRIAHGTPAEQGSNTSKVAEERIYRWEMLLEDMMKQILRSVRGDSFVGSDDDNEEREEKNETTRTGDGGRFGSQRPQVKSKENSSLANCGCAHLQDGRQPCSSRDGSHQFIHRGADFSPSEKAQGRDCQAFERNTEVEAAVNSPPYRKIDVQLTQLLHIAYRLFLGESSSANDGDDDHSVSGGNMHKAPEGAEVQGCNRTHCSFSRSVLDILSPHQLGARAKDGRTEEEEEEEEGRPVCERRPKTELCWRCHSSRRTRCNAAYTKFLEILRSLRSHMATNGSFVSDSYPQGMEEAEEKDEINGSDSAALSRHARVSSFHSRFRETWAGASPAGTPSRDEGTLLLKARQLSDSLQKRTNDRVNEQTAVKYMQSELDKEREWRRQLQDELLRLRLRLSRCESKFDFIDETVKPKLSKEIAQLEQKISERKRQEETVRKRRATFMSEIQKRLQKVVYENDLRPLPSSAASFLLSPRRL